MTSRTARTGARVEAQAKLNLYLRVRSREASGYHQIETLFQRISLADSVRVHVGFAGRSLDCRGADTGPTERNLAWRAAIAFAAAASWPGGFSIEIEKRIPVGAGLGGGSADAAAVLRALNALAPTPLSDESLARLALALGADVPYLTSEASLALASGRGETFVGLDPLPVRRVVLLVPPFGISSGDAFTWYDVMHGDDATTDGSWQGGTSADWPVVAAHAANDLEPPVFARHPSLAGLRDDLASAGAFIARMTGSGSAIFGIFSGEAAASSPAVPLARAGARTIEASTVDQVAPVELD